MKQNTRFKTFGNIGYRLSLHESNGRYIYRWRYTHHRPKKYKLQRSISNHKLFSFCSDFV